MQPDKMQAELDKVVSALGDFYARESLLFEKDLGERTFSHRLAVQVEKQFGGWDVDCDYNRLGERRLRLPAGTVISTDDGNGKSVFPDIVVHHRAIPENLIAIEVRKATNHLPPEHDQHKLRGLTDPHLWFAFQMGVMVTLAKNHVVTSEVYVGGAVDPALSRWFSWRLEAAGLAE
jgi:hypothetical protein